MKVHLRPFLLILFENLLRFFPSKVTAIEKDPKFVKYISIRDLIFSDYNRKVRPPSKLRQIAPGAI